MYIFKTSMGIKRAEKKRIDATEKSYEDCATRTAEISLCRVEMCDCLQQRPYRASPASG